MEIGSQQTSSAGLAVGGLLKTLQTEALKGQLIDKSLKALDQPKNAQAGAVGDDLQKSARGALHIGLTIDAIV